MLKRLKRKLLGAKALPKGHKGKNISIIVQKHHQQLIICTNTEKTLFNLLKSQVEEEEKVVRIPI